MNKLNKIGISALCGSLAAFSAAQAGDLTVSGGADLTWMTKDDRVTGNPLGIGSDFAFAGSGELDNGWTVDLSIAHTNVGGYSNASVTIGVPGVGDILFNQGGSGTGIQRLDDITPTVWEEADGAGQSATINKITGGSAGASIEVTPSALPDGLVGRFAYTADADGGSSINDKTSGGDSAYAGSGWDITLEATEDLHGVSGLTLYGGMSEVDQNTHYAAVNGNRDEDVWGVKYAMGSFTVGYQQSTEDTGLTGTAEYENTSYGITFSVNDDLSIGYGHIDSDQSGSANDPEADSIQASYTMGGATFRIAEVDVENSGYQSTAESDTSATIISLGLAF
jgi:outer membrane protein OmpU